MPILLEDLNLKNAERMLCERALESGGSIVEAAQLLGITRHALKRRIIKHQIQWPRRPANRLPGAEHHAGPQVVPHGGGIPPHSFNPHA